MGKINYAVQRSERVPNNQKGRTSLSNAYPRHPDRPPPSSPFHPRTRALRTSWIPRSGMVMLIVSWSTRDGPVIPRDTDFWASVLQCVSLGYPLPGLNISQSTPICPSNDSTRTLVSVLYVLWRVMCNAIDRYIHDQPLFFRWYSQRLRDTDHSNIAIYSCLSRWSRQTRGKITMRIWVLRPMRSWRISRSSLGG